jgi:hypothetical protein
MTDGQLSCPFLHQLARLLGNSARVLSYRVSAIGTDDASRVAPPSTLDQESASPGLVSKARLPRLGIRPGGLKSGWPPFSRMTTALPLIFAQPTHADAVRYCDRATAYLSRMSSLSLPIPSGLRAFCGEVDPVRYRQCGATRSRADSIQVETAL